MLYCLIACNFNSCVYPFLIPAQRKGANEISSTTECPNSTGLPQTETGQSTYTLLIMGFCCNFYIKIFGVLETKSSMSNEKIIFL